MSNAYNKELINIAMKCAEDNEIEIQEGTYMMFTGPNYETPAEIRMSRIIGRRCSGYVNST